MTGQNLDGTLAEVGPTTPPHDHGNLLRLVRARLYEHARKEYGLTVAQLSMIFGYKRSTIYGDLKALHSALAESALDEERVGAGQLC